MEPKIEFRRRKKLGFFKSLIISIFGILIILASIKTIMDTVSITEKPVGENSKQIQVNINELERFGIDLSLEEEYTINDEDAKSDIDYMLPQNIEDGNILFAWCWSFETITENLPKIAQAGYNTVQTSPVNLTYCDPAIGMELTGNGNWEYQKENIDWKIGNYQLGTKEQLQNLCAEAEKYGIHIIVEVNPNDISECLMSSENDLTKAVGSLQNLIHAQGHLEFSEKNNRKIMLFRKTGNALDANTECHAYQDYFVEFLKECVDIGVDGFRFDKVQYIGLPTDRYIDANSSENDFWPNVMTAIKEYDSDLFIYGDYSLDTYKDYFYNNEDTFKVELKNERAKATQYAQAYVDQIGKLSSNVFGANLRHTMYNKQKILSGNLEECYKNITDISNMVLQIEGGDEYTDNTWKTLSEGQIKLAWAIMAARGKGTPMFFSRPTCTDISNTVDGWKGNQNLVGEEGDQLYYDATIVELNKFHNFMMGEEEQLVYVEDGTNKGNLVMIERGNKGAVIVNLGEDFEVELKTQLLDGAYVNKLDSDLVYEVKDGMLKGNVPSSSIIILYGEENAKDNCPVISVEGAKDNFYQDEITLKIKVENAEHATFSLGGKSYKLEDRKELTLGSNMKNGDSVTLEVRAISKEGIISEQSYTMTKKDKDVDGMVIYFRKPDNWMSNVYIYYYTAESPTNEAVVNKEYEFPGVLMQLVEEDNKGNELYQYVLPADFVKNGRLIFTDGTNQYPNNQIKGISNISNGYIYTAN